MGRDGRWIQMARIRGGCGGAVVYQIKPRRRGHQRQGRVRVRAAFAAARYVQHMAGWNQWGQRMGEFPRRCGGLGAARRAGAGADAKTHIVGMGDE